MGDESLWPEDSRSPAGPLVFAEPHRDYLFILPCLSCNVPWVIWATFSLSICNINSKMCRAPYPLDVKADSCVSSLRCTGAALAAKQTREVTVRQCRLIYFLWMRCEGIWVKYREGDYRDLAFWHMRNICCGIYMRCSLDGDPSLPGVNRTLSYFMVVTEPEFHFRQGTARNWREHNSHQ